MSTTIEKACVPCGGTGQTILTNSPLVHEECVSCGGTGIGAVGTIDLDPLYNKIKADLTTLYQEIKDDLTAHHQAIMNKLNE